MTEKQTHTPGPWEVHVAATTRHGYDIQNRDESKLIAYNLKNKANAALIAAAPDLLAALKDMAEFSNGRCRVCGCGFDDGYCGCEPNADDVINRRREAAIAAIAKAEGRNE